MNNINEVYLAGYMVSAPVRVTPRPGHTLTVEFELSIEREKTSKHHRITVAAMDDNAATILSAQLGSYVFVPRGTLVSANYIREQAVVCGHCHRGDVLEIASESTIPVATGQIIIVEKPKSKSLGGVNEVRLLGNITNDTSKTYFKSKSGHTYAQAKIAVDRPKYKTSADGSRADYIFSNGFSKVADFLATKFNKGELIYVKGHVSERKVKQNIKYNCAHSDCAGVTEIEVDNSVREVIIDEFVQFPTKYQVADVQVLDSELKKYEDEYTYVESVKLEGGEDMYNDSEDEDNPYGDYNTGSENPFDI